MNRCYFTYEWLQIRRLEPKYMDVCRPLRPGCRSTEAVVAGRCRWKWQTFPKHLEHLTEIRPEKNKIITMRTSSNICYKVLVFFFQIILMGYAVQSVQQNLHSLFCTQTVASRSKTSHSLRPTHTRRKRNRRRFLNHLWTRRSENKSDSDFSLIFFALARCG